MKKYLKELEATGFQLLKKNGYQSEKDFYFESKGFDNFFKHTMTRDKLIKIILNYDEIKTSMKKRYNSPLRNFTEFENCSQVYDKIKDTCIEQMRRRGIWKSIHSKLDTKAQIYISFVGNALDYNEDNLLLRSISFHNAMKDRDLGKRFYELIEACLNMVDNTDLNEDVFIIAGWIPDMGRKDDPQNHHLISMKYLDGFLNHNKEFLSLRNEIEYCILDHRSDGNPKTICGRIFQLADKVASITKNG